MKTLSLFDFITDEETKYDTLQEIEPPKDETSEGYVSNEEVDIDTELLKELQLFEFSKETLNEELSFLENYYNEWHISKDLKRINTLKYYLKN